VLCERSSTRLHRHLYIFSQSVGFSKSCSASDIKELSETFEIFKFTDIIQPQQEALPLGGYVTIAILAFFALVVFISTVLVEVHRRTKRFKLIAGHDYFALQRSLKVFTRSGEIKFLNGLKTVCFLTVIFGTWLPLA
jgi:hypothetical protein